MEDGSGVAGANSYVSIADADAFHEARGNSDWTDVSSSPDQGKAAALIRGTAYIDAKYRARFPGSRTNGRDQTLEWPRTDACDAEGEEISSDEIPQEIKDAVCEAALRELSEAGSLMPDVDAGGLEKRIKAGSVEIERFANGPAAPSFSIIDGILSGILKGTGSIYTARAVRG